MLEIRSLKPWRARQLGGMSEESGPTGQSLDRFLRLAEEIWCVWERVVGREACFTAEPALGGRKEGGEQSTWPPTFAVNSLLEV